MRVVWQIAPSVVSLGVGMGTDLVHCPSPENRGSWEWDARGRQLKQLGASPDAHCVCTQSALSQTGHQDPTQWLEQESHQIANRRQTHRQCTWERLWYITRNGRGGINATFSSHDLQQHRHSTEKFKVCNIPDLLKSRNVWNPRAGGKKAGVAQAGGQERNLQVFIFKSHPALSDPLGAWRPLLPPSRARR